MRFRLKKGLNNDGFILVIAILLIGLLMIFMTAIINVVNYTNKRTLVKSVDQQLQITAQSASFVIKDFLLEKLADPAIAEAMRNKLENGPMLQDYAMADGFVNVKISKIKGVNKALVTVYATSRDDVGAAGVVSFVIKLSGNGPKNELFDNLVVAYNPEKESKSIVDRDASIDYKDVVMEGDILVDNRYRESLNYGIRSRYEKFADNMLDDKAVYIKNGMYTGIKTTGNLMLTGNIFGFKPADSKTKDVDFISSEGQMVIRNARIGGTFTGADKNNSYIVSTIGAGGYASDENGTNAGKLVMDDVVMQEGNVPNSESDTDGKPRASIITSEGVDIVIDKIDGFTQRIFSGGNLNINSTKGKNTINDIEAMGKANIRSTNLIDAKSVISRGDNTVNSKMYVTDKLASVEGSLKVQSDSVQARYFLAGEALDISSNAKSTDKEKPSAFSVKDNYRIPRNMIKGDAAFIYFIRDAEGILNSPKIFEIGKAVQGEKPVEKINLYTPNYYLSTKSTTEENKSLATLVSSDTQNVYFEYEEDSDGYLLKNTKGGYKNFGLLIIKGDSDAERKMSVMKDDRAVDVDISGKTLYIDITGNDLNDDYLGERTGIKGQRCMDILLSPGDEGDTVVLNNKIVIRYSMPYTDEAHLINMDYVRFFVEGDNNVELGENFSIEYENKNNVHVDDKGFDFDDRHYTKLKPDVYFIGLKEADKKPKFTVKCKYLNAVILAPYTFVDFSNVDEKNKTVFEGSVICKNFAMPKAGVCKSYKPFSLDYAMSDDVFRYVE